MSSHPENDLSEGVVKGAGLGLLASASLFMSGSRKSTAISHETGELSPSDSQGRRSVDANSYSGESNPSDREEGSSDIDESDAISNSNDEAWLPREEMKSAWYKPPLFGVDISAMEYAMDQFLSQASKSEPHLKSTTRTSCRLCSFTDASYDRLIEHMIVEHRLSLLRSMHELNLIGMRQHHCVRMQTDKMNDLGNLFTAISSAAMSSVLEIAQLSPPDTDGSSASTMTPFVEKVLKDGPTAWIMEYAKCNKRIRPELAPEPNLVPKHFRVQEFPLSYPICPITSRATSKLGPGYQDHSIRESPGYEGVVEVPFASKYDHNPQSNAKTIWPRI
uniref:Uncharacterized protein n=2 Tax=Spongospora subterranea TaxID=70186 RepID=A0A0H5QKD1_9EUKA|eukprot:CRZ01771.1 hypothetical protein [Spongospora subterranea]